MKTLKVMALEVGKKYKIRKYLLESDSSKMVDSVIFVKSMKKYKIVTVSYKRLKTFSVEENPYTYTLGMLEIENDEARWLKI